MASDFVLRVGLIDAHSVKSQIEYQMTQVAGVDDATAFANALQLADNILDALKALTDATVYSVSLAFPWATQVESGVPAGSVDVAIEALLTVYINETGDPVKYGQLRIPAPIAALFEADGMTVDRSLAALGTYMEALEDGGITLSDGESPNLSLGVNGIARGTYRSRARRPQVG